MIVRINLKCQHISHFFNTTRPQLRDTLQGGAAPQSGFSFLFFFRFPLKVTVQMSWSFSA